MLMVNNNKAFFKVTGCEALNGRGSGHGHRWVVVNVTVNVDAVK